MTDEEWQLVAEVEIAKDERIAELEQDNKRLRDAVLQFMLAYKQVEIDVSSCSRPGRSAELLLALVDALRGRE